ncbi:hypothetical protein TNCV_2727751 [Trichonephila clavipes]|nr:hypothetical protein TNCV_2727751 [Trichonephila clavipes]
MLTRISGLLRRTVSVVCFRLSTGRGFFQDYLYRKGMTDSSSFPLCDHDVLMTEDHLKVRTAVLKSISLNVVDCAVDDSVYRSKLH